MDAPGPGLQGRLRRSAARLPLTGARFAGWSWWRARRLVRWGRRLARHVVGRSRRRAWRRERSRDRENSELPRVQLSTPDSSDPLRSLPLGARNVLSRAGKRGGVWYPIWASDRLTYFGEFPLAMEVLDRLAARRPRDPVVRLSLITTQRRLSGTPRHGDMEALLRCDLRQVNPKYVVTAVFGFAAPPILESLGEIFRRPAMVRRSPDIHQAQELVELALACAHAHEPDDIARLALSSTTASAMVRRWVALHNRRDVAIRIYDLATFRAPLATVHDSRLLGKVCSDVAQSFLTLGDLSRARSAALDALAFGDDDRLRALIDYTTQALEVSVVGWSFPPRPSGRLRPLTPGHPIAYLLQNSRPYTSVGYAIRSQGILRALTARKWRMVGVTRPGYPHIRPEGRLRGRAAITEVDLVDGVPYRRLGTPMNSATERERVEHFAQMITAAHAEYPWQLIHAASPARNGIAAVHAARQLGIPSIYEVRGLLPLTRASRDPGFEATDEYEYALRLEVEACRGADRVFAITEAVKNILCSRGVDPSHVDILPNGVNTDAIRPRSVNTDLKSALGLDGKTVIGYVGTMLAYEGLDLALRALRTLRDSGLPATLLLVGDGPALPGLRSLTHELHLDDSVVFTGRVPHDEVDDYYSLVDIAPFPRLPLSVTEAVSPLKPFEAMAAGKAVVVSDVAALAEMVTHGETGMLFKKGDADSLAAVFQLLVQDASLRNELAERSREWVVAHRDWNVLIESVDATYRALGALPPS